MTDIEKKRILYVLCFVYYSKYSDFSVDQLRSSLLDLYQSKNLLSFFEIVFLESLIELRLR